MTLESLRKDTFKKVSGIKGFIAVRLEYSSSVRWCEIYYIGNELKYLLSQEVEEIVVVVLGRETGTVLMKNVVTTTLVGGTPVISAILQDQMEVVVVVVEILVSSSK